MKNVDQQGMEEFLKLDIVSQSYVSIGEQDWPASKKTKSCTQPSYKSHYKFLKAIDQLPTGPEWTCELVKVHRDIVTEDTEESGDDEAKECLELWHHDPVSWLAMWPSDQRSHTHLSRYTQTMREEWDGMMKCGWETGGGRHRWDLKQWIDG